CTVVLVGWHEGIPRTPVSVRFYTLTIAGLVFLGCLAPWLVRGHRLTGEYVLSTEAWQTSAMANNDSGGVYFTSKGLAGMPPTSIEQSEIERERIYKAFVLDWVAKHPTKFLLFYLKRALSFWSPFLQDATFTQALFGVTFNAMLLVFAITCVVTYRRLWRKLLSIY